MDEEKLIERLGLIEALFVGAATPGEREAAGRARERIMARLREVEQRDPPIEYKFTMSNPWSRCVLVTLLRRYGINPYRYKGQRHTTVMARVPASFVDETLWPQFERFDHILTAHLTEVTDRVVAQVLQTEVSEADVVAGPRQLSLDAGPDRSASAMANSPGGSPGMSAPLRADDHRSPPVSASRTPGPTHGDSKVGRNAPCPCGSGKKYKRCCGRAG